MKSFFVVFLTFFFANSVYADATMQASQLFDFFKASCPVEGSWTDAAVAQSQNIVQILQSVANDPACVSLSGAVGQLNMLKQKVAELASRTDEHDLIGLRKQEHELLMQLASSSKHPETNSQLIEIIKEQLQSVQQSIAATKGHISANQSVYHQDDANQFQDLVITTNVILSQAALNHDCLTKFPSILANLASLAGSVGAAMLTSGMSLGVAAGAQILGSVIEYVRINKIESKIGAFAKNIASDAYRCVMESLTNEWCSSEDSLNVVKIKQKALTEPTSNDPFWIGTQLLDRQIPDLLAWLSVVQSGTAASNVAVAQGRDSAYNRDAVVKAARGYVDGVLTEKKPLFDLAPDSTSKWVVERAAINKILSNIGVLSSSSVNSAADLVKTLNNPLGEIHSPAYAPYFLLGLDQSEVPQPNGVIKPFENFDPFKEWPQGHHPNTFTPDLELVRAQLSDWISQAAQLTQTELTYANQPDPQAVINDAKFVVKGRSPYLALRQILVFLTKYPPTGFGYEAQDLYDDTVKRLQSIVREIDTAVNPPRFGLLSLYNPSNPGQILNQVSSVARLDQGVGLIAGRMDRAIRLALNYIIVHGGQHFEPSAAAQLLASDDIIRDLETFSGQGNLTMIRLGLERGQGTTEVNLQSFTETFQDSLIEILKSYNESTDVRASRAKSVLCLELLAVPSLKKEDLRQLCMGAQLQSDYEGGPSSVEITPDLFSKPISERACYFRDYLRAAKIYQDYESSRK